MGLFSVNVSAAVNATIPSSRPPILAAAINIDPDPNKGLGDSQTISDNALVSHDGPAGTTANVTGSTPSDRISVYEVKKGNTLSEIADLFGVSVNTIIWANNLSGVNDVHPGDILIILPVSGISHTVLKGETLASLAKKYNADANEIAQYNGLDPAVFLKGGSTIIIPGGEISAPAPVKRPTSTPTTNNPSRAGGSFVAGYFSSPLPSGIITQGLHDGNAVDIGAARGTPIHAAADGTVIIVRSNGGWNGGYGNYVVITHNNGTQTLYAHMKSAIVSAGQSVSSSQIIGYVGMTGRTTGPHVHFEVRGAANPFASCALYSICSPQ